MRPVRLRPLFAVQALMGAGIYLCGFYIARLVTRSDAAALIVLFVLITGGAFAPYFGLVLTETTTFLFVFAALAFWTRLIEAPRDRLALALAVGFFLGLAALTRPSYQYLAPMMALGALISLAPLEVRPRGGRRLLHAGAVIAGFIVAVAPWLLRNLALFDVAAITHGYSEIILIQRLAYNSMTWKAYLASFVHWFPRLGPPLADTLCPEAWSARLGWLSPGGFYQTRWELLAEVRAEVGGVDNLTTGYLIREYLLGDLFKHLAVTLSLVVRGMWAGGFWSALAILLLPAAAIALAKRGRLGVAALMAAGPVFMLGFHAFISVNPTRYNEPLALVYATIIGAAALALRDLWRGGRRAGAR